MHDELKDYTEVLSDVEYQRRVWVDKEKPTSLMTFDDIIHFYFDDTDLSTDADGCIGWFLRNQAEADAVRQVVGVIDVVLDEYEGTATDAEYIRAPHWPDVVAAAKSLLAIMDTADDAAA
jgi:hypothetical protein